MLLCATAPLTLLALALDQAPAPTTKATLSLLVLGLASTAGGFTAFFALIHTAGPATAALITYAAPVVATIVGVGILAEPFTAGTTAGTGIVLLGAAITATRRTKPRPTPSGTPDVRPGSRDESQ